MKRPKTIAIPQPYSTLFICKVVDDAYSNQWVQLVSNCYGDGHTVNLYTAKQCRKVAEWLLKVADYMAEAKKEKK